MDALSIAQSGLLAAENSLVVSANNVANMGTVGKLPATSPQVPLPAAASGPASAYQAMDSVNISRGASGGVQSIGQPRLPSYSVGYQPDSSDANAAGLVAEPNVDSVQERVTQISAFHAYQANAAVLRTSAQMQNTLFSAVA